MNSELWIEERFEDFYGIRFRVDRTLFSGQSDFQKVDIVETRGHGKMLLNDGLVMITERDEFIYHDMIVHVPMFSHPNPKSVLVIGGGDGGSAREVLRHSSVESCVMVEIDPVVVEGCRKHIPQTSACFSNPKLELLIEDGVKYVKETDKKFDVIIVDSTDPIGPAQPLFGPEFYQDINKCLNDNGIVVSQAESPFYAAPMQEKLMSIVSEIFPIARAYNYHNLTYPGGLWTFSYGSKGVHPLKDLDETKSKKSGLEFGYYNNEIHKAAFALPNFQLEKIKKYFKD